MEVNMMNLPNIIQSAGANSIGVDCGKVRVVRAAEHRVPLKLSAAETGNAFALVVVRTMPGASIPSQVRHFEDKTFFVLEGFYSFQVGDEKFDLVAGDLVFVPRGTKHSYHNPMSRASRLLVLSSPGSIHGRLLEAIGRAAANPSFLDKPSGLAEVQPVASADRLTIREPADTKEDSIHTISPGEFFKQRYPKGRVIPMSAKRASQPLSSNSRHSSPTESSLFDEPVTWQDAEWQ
jgi:mannose-6-phosphate isomerase-like protein (cupin superfamily)